MTIDYKIIAKIKPNRLKPVLVRILNGYQVGALPGRSIDTNLLTVRNLLLNSGEKTPGAILTLDFARAYDRVDRNMLYAILAKFGFSADIVRIVQNLYEGCQSRVIINGELGDGIPMNREGGE